MNETYEMNQGFDVGGRTRGRAAAMSLNEYIARTFLWMAAGLALTFAIGWWMAINGMVNNLLSGMGTALFIVVAIAELGVAIFMTARVNKMSVGAARACFFVYAALSGVTFSIYFVGFNLSILIYAFLATAAFFGGMAAVTLVFHLDLSRIRNFLYGGLVFLLITGVAGMLFRLEFLMILECWAGIAIFIGYTAYDTQMIVRNYYAYAGNDTLLKKASIYSALQLYLDFVNLLIRILQIFGRSSSSD